MPKMNYLDAVVKRKVQTGPHVVGFIVLLIWLQERHYVQKFWVEVVCERYDVVGVIEVRIQQVLLDKS